MRLLVCNLTTAASRCLTRELLCLECWAGVLGKVPELVTKLPCLCFKRTESVFGMLPELGVGVPGCHIKQQIENCPIVRWEEKAIEDRNTTLDGALKKAKQHCNMTDLEDVFEVPSSRILHCGHITRKFPNCVPTERWDEAEPGQLSVLEP